MECWECAIADDFQQLRRDTVRSLRAWGSASDGFRACAIIDHFLNLMNAQEIRSALMELTIYCAWSAERVR